MTSYWQSTGTPKIKFFDREGDSVSISALVEGNILVVFEHEGEKLEYLIKKATKKVGIAMIGRNSN